MKTEKTHRHISLEQEVNLVQIPHPSKAMFKFPPLGHDAQSNAQGLPGGGGGMLKLQFDRYRRDYFSSGVESADVFLSVLYSLLLNFLLTIADSMK